MQKNLGTRVAIFFRTLKRQFTIKELTHRHISQEHARVRSLQLSPCSERRETDEVRERRVSCGPLSGRMSLRLAVL